MPLPFALTVQRLNRQGLTVAAIAVALDAPEADVRAAHRLLYLALNDSIEPSVERSEQARQAELDRMPKRMQDRIRQSRSP